MTTGMSFFSTKGRKIAKPKPLPADVYTLTIPAQKWSIEVGKQAKSMPYVKGYLEVEHEGAKRRIYVNFHNGLTPSKKDGAAMVDRKNGITAFGAAVGQPLVDASVLTKTYVSEETGASETEEYVDPKAVISYLDNLAGTTVRAKVKIEGNADDEYGEKNVVAAFLPALES